MKEFKEMMQKVAEGLYNEAMKNKEFTAKQVNKAVDETMAEILKEMRIKING